jgi:hypothetical protein
LELLAGADDVRWEASLITMDRAQQLVETGVWGYGMVGAKVAIAAKLKHHQAVQQWYDPCLDHHDQDNSIIA